MEEGELRQRVRELLARVGMEEALAKMPSDISGGMKKRVGLARALALDPEIMLLDEPTAGLDPITAAEIIELIGELGKAGERSAIVVTHDLRSVEALADRVALLKEGSIVDKIRMPRHSGEKVTVVMKLKKATQEVIKKDSVASIETEGLLGAKYVAVSLGSTQSEPVRDGDGIGSRPPLDLGELAKKAS